MTRQYIFHRLYIYSCVSFSPVAFLKVIMFTCSPGGLGEEDLAAQHILVEVGAITYMVGITSITLIQTVTEASQ